MSKILKVAGLFIALLGFLLIMPGITAHAEATDIIWIGDSRSVGLAQASLRLGTTAGSGGEAETVAHKDGYHFIAKCSQGLYWGKDAISKIDESDGNTIVIWLGVNDLGNKEKYRTWLTELTGSYNVYLVSVTQCYSPSSISNDRISDFNEMLKSIEGATYIDAYSYFEASAPSTDAMGVHYGSSDYRLVYDLVKAELTGSPAPNIVQAANNVQTTNDVQTTSVIETTNVYRTANNRQTTNIKLYFRVQKPAFMPSADYSALKRRYSLSITEAS